MTQLVPAERSSVHTGTKYFMVHPFVAPLRRVRARMRVLPHATATSDAVTAVQWIANRLQARGGLVEPQVLAPAYPVQHAPAPAAPVAVQHAVAAPELALEAATAAAARPDAQSRVNPLLDFRFDTAAIMRAYRAGT